MDMPHVEGTWERRAAGALEQSVGQAYTARPRSRVRLPPAARSRSVHVAFFHGVLHWGGVWALVRVQTPLDCRAIAAG